MSDYIRKQDAVDALPKPQICEYMDEFGAGRNSCAYDAEKAIKDVPAADVAPVVHCRDCARLNRNGYCTRFQNNISGIATSWFMPDDDDFCSYGERKEQNHVDVDT